MATVPGVTSFPEKNVMKIVWSAVTENDTFGAVQCGSGYTDRIVELAGTVGGATILIKGSVAGSNYYTLNGPSGPLSLAAVGMSAIVESTPYLQPTHSGGSSESVTVTVRLTAYF